MKVAVMQPYFFPYIGYFQLICTVDLFIVYDNIKFTKKGWVNRNRMLQSGKDVLFSLPVKNDSDSLDVCDRSLAVEFNRNKLLNQISGAYMNAPQFAKTIAFIEEIVLNKEQNLFKFLHHSIMKTCEYIGVTTEIRVSSEIVIDHGLKSQDKVLALCQATGAKTYVNTIGGTELYSKSDFIARGVELKFVKSRPFKYTQFGNEFVPWLSIIDVMMFNPLEAIRECITSNYELI